MPLGRRSRTIAGSSRSRSSSGLDRIAVDGEALDDGLVVVTSASPMGTAADIADRVPAGTAARRRPPASAIELLSAVDHALVLGVPTIDPDARTGPAAGPRAARSCSRTSSPTRRCALLAEGRQDTTRLISDRCWAAAASASLTGLVWAVVDAVL